MSSASDTSNDLAAVAADAAQAFCDAHGRIKDAVGRAIVGQTEAIDAALAEVKRSGALPVPMHLRNAPTQHMQDEGYGAGYRYPHDHPYGVVAQRYRPDELDGIRWYEPRPWGEEKRIAERLAFWARKQEE